ncbi:hypothetical protein [Paragemmobacter ruber]|uniref:Uncharacterized protein n=1 Tax=Paragemmobacter ruber TaxID=1985673 RepID=A0ABW9Y0S7_9RHOB|nr:hypothetical protein [Rhodobacter ruber]NBE06092.1 hypothetical protein [Rhodobacter ruber]
MIRTAALAALVSLFLPHPTRAENIGIDFRTMPVGCSWTVRYSNGNLWIHTFKGRKGGAYVTEVREDTTTGPLVSRIRYNKRGWMTERVWADGKWERFSPYSCFGELGKCSSTYTNADGVRLEMVNTTTKAGNTYTVEGRVKDGDVYPTEYFTLGPFNVTTMNKSSNYWAETKNFYNCGLGSS